MSYGKSFDFILNQLRNFSGSLAGGTVEFFSAGTTSQLAVFLDRSMNVTAANPYRLSADGNAELFGNGVYRIVVKNSSGVIVYTFDNIEVLTSSQGGAPALTADGSTHVVVNALTGDTDYTLPVSYNQYVTRTGDSAFILSVLAPGGYLFPDGTDTFQMFSDGETVGFLLNDTTFYPVI